MLDRSFSALFTRADKLIVSNILYKHVAKLIKKEFLKVKFRIYEL